MSTPEDNLSEWHKLPQIQYRQLEMVSQVARHMLKTIEKSPKKKTKSIYFRTSTTCKLTNERIHGIQIHGERSLARISRRLVFTDVRCPCPPHRVPCETQMSPRKMGTSLVTSTVRELAMVYNLVRGRVYMLRAYIE